MSEINNEILKEAYFDLERSREKEVQSRLVSESLLKAITIISNTVDSELLFKELFAHLQISIGFTSANLFQVISEVSQTGDMKYHYKNQFSTRISNTETTGPLSNFIIKKISSVKAINLFEVNEAHDVYNMLGEEVKSFILIPFKSNSSEYFAILSSDQKSFYTQFHNEMASKLIPIFKQAMNQGEYLTSMLQASKMSALGEMASGIAHEINNPLTIIAMSMMYLKKMQKNDKVTPEVLLTVIEEVEQTVQRLTKIVSGMGTVSRGSHNIETAPLKLKDILTDILGLYSEKFRHASIVLDANLDSPELLCEIISDRVQLSQVFINLIGNAYDAVKDTPDAWVKIHFNRDEKNIRIIITDSGHGIPTVVKNKIFAPFFTTKPIGKGTGLGLSISKGIIEKLGGSLELDSHSVNTRFIVSIPSQYEEVIASNLPPVTPTKNIALRKS